MKSQLNNEKGATLVFVLVIFVFISIIALGVISVATNESLHAIEKNKKIQAEYLALSGIQIMTEYIENYYDDFVEKYEDYDSNFPVEFDLDDLGEDGKSTVEIIENETTKQLQIVATGEYKGVTYKKKRNINLIKMPVSNDLPESFYISSQDIPNYKPVDLPTNYTDYNPSNISYNGNGNILELTDEVYRFNSFTVNTNAELLIKADLEDKKSTRTIIVDSFEAKQNSLIKIDSDLTLIIYVIGNSTFREAIPYEYIDGTETIENGTVVMMISSGVNVNFNINSPAGTNTVEFNAFVYGPEATFDFKNHTEFLGFVVGEEEYPDLVGQSEGTYLEPTPDLKEFFMQNMYDEYERFIPQDYVK